MCLPDLIVKKQLGVASEAAVGAASPQLNMPPPLHVTIGSVAGAGYLNSETAFQLKNYRGIFQTLHLDMFPNVVPVENLMHVPKCPTDATEKQCLEAIV